MSVYLERTAETVLMLAMSGLWQMWQYSLLEEN
jgi:hypothetical protein